MSTLAERIREAMTDADGGRGITSAELARRARVTRSAVAHWLSGSTAELKGDNLLAVAAALGVTPTWLSHGIGPKVGAAARIEGGSVAVWEKPQDLAGDEDRVWIDRWDYRVSAGEGGVQWEVREKAALPFTLSFFQAIGSKPANCKLIMVRGDSMEPFLFNRDMMMVDTSKTGLRDGVVYAVLFEDEPLVKQVFKKAGGALVLHSYNPRFPDREVPMESMERLQIIGEVVYRSGAGFAAN
jgi:phage repressor protein C with HTH and peptisase S24 domain